MTYVTICATAFAIVPMSIASVSAQETSAEATRLDTVVELAAGERTIESIAAELSGKTGLTIEVQDCIGSRKVTTWIAKLAARDALDALAGLNDWTWSHVAPQHYRISRRTIRRPARLADVSMAVVNSFPRDIREYAGMMSASEGSVGARYRSLFSTAAGRTKSRLVASLAQSNMLDADRVEYSKLTADQRAILLIAETMDALDGMQEIISGEEHLYTIDPGETTLRLDRNGVLLVTGTMPSGTKAAFGKNVKAP